MGSSAANGSSKKEQRRVARQRPRDSHTLFLSAGELARISGREIRRAGALRR